ncbi:MAG TPA: amino acid racemase [Candidatus Angelobacter sp.]|nr:amino acid racemase [Candidatus Angelobacter sp.]
MISKGHERTENGEVWGIVGGMGPLASAEFVSTIYRDTARWTEQESPTVILLSDPTVPDRTECLLNGRHEILLQKLAGSVETLLAMGATRIVICCLTIHPLIHRLAPALREKIVSLVDLTLDAVQRSRSRHLLLCTTGTKKLRLFQEHWLWNETEHKVVLPDDDDQDAIHRMLYEIKNQREAIAYIPFVEELMKKYGVSSYIAGCTEMHIVAKAHEQFSGHDRREFCIDPLTEILPMMQRNVLTSAGRSV